MSNKPKAYTELVQQAEKAQLKYKCLVSTDLVQHINLNDYNDRISLQSITDAITEGYEKAVKLIDAKDREKMLHIVHICNINEEEHVTIRGRTYKESVKLFKAAPELLKALTDIIDTLDATPADEALLGEDTAAARDLLKKVSV